jgi:hypothetical protein
MWRGGMDILAYVASVGKQWPNLRNAQIRCTWNFCWYGLENSKHFPGIFAHAKAYDCIRAPQAANEIQILKIDWSTTRCLTKHLFKISCQYTFTSEIVANESNSIELDRI